MIHDCIVQLGQVFLLLRCLSLSFQHSTVQQLSLICSRLLILSLTRLWAQVIKDVTIKELSLLRFYLKLFPLPNSSFQVQSEHLSRSCLWPELLIALALAYGASAVMMEENLLSTLQMILKFYYSDELLFVIGKILNNPYFCVITVQM